MPTIPDGKLCIYKEGERQSPCSAPCQTSRLSLSAVCVLKCRTNHSMTPYLKENLPKRLHFAYNDRIERGHLYMKSGWQAALWVSLARLDRKKADSRDVLNLNVFLQYSALNGCFNACYAITNVEKMGEKPNWYQEKWLYAFIGSV